MQKCSICIKRDISDDKVPFQGKQ